MNLFYSSNNKSPSLKSKLHFSSNQLSYQPVTFFSTSPNNSHHAVHPNSHPHQQLFNGNNQATSFAAALLHNYPSPNSFISFQAHQQHDLLLQHMQRAAVAAAAAATHVAASHRRRKARTVFSDQQLHGLERR